MKGIELHIVNFFQVCQETSTNLGTVGVLVDDIRYFSRWPRAHCTGESISPRSEMIKTTNVIHLMQ